MSRQADIQRHARQEFAAPGSTFDRLINFLRIGLPVGVGIILAILAIAPVSSGNEFSFLLDRNEVAMAPERLRVVQALYRGEDKSGQPFALRAQSARQKSSDEPILEIEGMEADFTVGEDRANVSARRGNYDLDKKWLFVPGALQFNRDNGDALTATKVIVDMDDKLIRSSTIGEDKDVQGRTGFGNFRSGGLFARMADRRLILTGGVTGTTDFGSYRANRLVYDFETDNVVLDGNAHLRID